MALTFTTVGLMMISSLAVFAPTGSGLPVSQSNDKETARRRSPYDTAQWSEQHPCPPYDSSSSDGIDLGPTVRDSVTAELSSDEFDSLSHSLTILLQRISDVKTQYDESPACGNDDMTDQVNKTDVCNAFGTYKTQDDDRLASGKSTASICQPGNNQDNLVSLAAGLKQTYCLLSATLETEKQIADTDYFTSTLVEQINQLVVDPMIGLRSILCRLHLITTTAKNVHSRIPSAGTNDVTEDVTRRRPVRPTGDSFYGQVARECRYLKTIAASLSGCLQLTKRLSQLS